MCNDQQVGVALRLQRIQRSPVVRKPGDHIHEPLAEPGRFLLAASNHAATSYGSVRSNAILPIKGRIGSLYHRALKETHLGD